MAFRFSLRRENRFDGGFIQRKDGIIRRLYLVLLARHISAASAPSRRSSLGAGGDGYLRAASSCVFILHSLCHFMQVADTNAALSSFAFLFSRAATIYRHHHQHRHHCLNSVSRIDRSAWAAPCLLLCISLATRHLLK